MSDALERVLQLVAEGKISADDAAPILEALSAGEGRGQGGPRTGQAAGVGGPTAAPSAAGAMPGGDPGGGPQPMAGAAGSADRARARVARIMVMEGGRRVVDLRVPASLGRFALGRVPGLSAEQVSELEEAISTGRTGPLLEVEDPDGDGVRIVLE